MDAALIQQLLNRLYTDTIYREDFLSNKELFYSKHNITSAETKEFLNALPAEQLQFFSNSLDLKRFHTVKHLIRLTLKAAGTASRELFTTYSQRYIPVGIHKHHDDALHFLLFLENEMTLKNQIADPSFFKEVIKYESVLLENFISEKKFRITFHSYDFARMYKTYVNEKTAPKKKRIVIVWKGNKIKNVISFF